MRVLCAPDSFKGSASAVEVADALASGWRSVRGGDDLLLCPMADGGDGTAEVLRHSCGGITVPLRVTGPVAGTVPAWWLLLGDGTAVVELALACGLPLLDRPDPMGAHTQGFGELLGAAARDSRVQRILATLGGSASTDGGTGALTALGAVFADSNGQTVGLGGRCLSQIAEVDLTRLCPAPTGGVRVLTDVRAPLCGPYGAASVFGPQKGATAQQICELDEGLVRLAGLLGGDATMPGAGAAGGTGYGLARCWGAELAGGAAGVGELLGLGEAIAGCDVILTGEGRLDATSLNGKVIGHLLSQAGGRPVLVCAGALGDLPDGVVADVVACADLAGSNQAAMADPRGWIMRAGATLARRM